MSDNCVLSVREPASPPIQHQMHNLPRILVAEDDPDILHLNTRVLISSGYAVDAVVDGYVAWEFLQDGDYDLVITDNNMPRLSGIDLLMNLWKSKKSMPVIMATGQVPHEIFTIFPYLKPSRTLLKPYTSGQLLEMVSEVLSQYVFAGSSPNIKGGVLGNGHS